MPKTDAVWEKIQQKVAAFEVVAAVDGIYHRGYRFWPPYACGRCGEPISAYQFAFSRSCGGCDSSESHTARLSIFDPRWFVLGEVELDNPGDDALIHPQFLPAYQRRDFAPIHPRLVPRKPMPPRRPIGPGIR